MTENHFETNKKHWDNLVKIHLKSKFYDLPSFKKGKTSLFPLELEELGDVTGKSLLHLQCHFGLDTISWAREGAIATGVDFSEKGIETARELSAELNVPAKFICSNIYDLPAVLDQKFDIVITTYGVIYWLNNLERWAQIVAYFLKPGGVFLVADSHPWSYLFDDSDYPNEIGYSYFVSSKAEEWEDYQSYIEEGEKVEHAKNYSWIHRLETIVNSIIKAGLKIESLNEYPFAVFPQYPAMEKDEKDGYWKLPNNDQSVPFIFAIKARK